MPIAICAVKNIWQKKKRERASTHAAITVSSSTSSSDSGFTAAVCKLKLSRISFEADFPMPMQCCANLGLDAKCC
eukprot:6197856-Pleurochrysis_carterae.AAC.1